MEAQEFLNNFTLKEMTIKEGYRKVLVKVYQCPKCTIKDWNDGTFINPINFLAHLIQACPDWINYVQDPKIFCFLNIEHLSRMLKGFMIHYQLMEKRVGVKQ